VKPLQPINLLTTGLATSTAGGETSGDRRENGVSHTAEPTNAVKPKDIPDPEVPEKTKRRKFTAAYKLRMLLESEQCTQPGEVGALLRREGLYSSHLTSWRKQREQGVLQGLNPKKRGRKPKPQDPSAKRIAQLEKENQRLKNRLKKAEIIIEAQKKISEILGVEQNLEDIDDK